MNHKCHGDHFTAEGAKHYRCSYDGAVGLDVKDGEACPSCGRIVVATDRGVLDVSTQIKRYVTLPDGREAILGLTQT